MAVYAIGDVQGCYDELRALLDALGFDPERDRLWLTGDLVNRGSQSLEVLRFVRGLGERAQVVLGNHDLHLLAIAAGVRPPRRKDHLEPVLQAPDREELLDWLRARPLLHSDATLGWALVHAGLPPQWDLAEACARAAELEAVLRGEEHDAFFRNMYGDGPALWSAKLSGWKRLRYITNCFTRLRFCDAKGRLALGAKGPPGSQSQKYLPWFAVPGRASAGERIVFGHWSTLGFHASGGAHCVDTGCIWGGELTALRLGREPPERFSVSCAMHCRPGER